jgi:hypothetical protein
MVPATGGLLMPNPDFIDPWFAAVAITSAWSYLFYLVIRDGRRHVSRRHFLNSSKED